jgi:hypothetical protein
VDDVNHRAPLRNSQRAARTEIVLHVDDEEYVLQSNLHWGFLVPSLGLAGCEKTRFGRNYRSGHCSLRINLKKAEWLSYSGASRFSNETDLGQRTTAGQPKIDVRIAKAPNTM